MLRVLLIAVIVILVAKFVFKISRKELIALILNAAVGFVIIWLINLTDLISLPLNWITALVAGIFGVPGVVILIVLTILGII